MDVQASFGLQAKSLASSTDPRALARIGEGADAAKRFQELLATMLVKEMRRSLPEGFFGSGSEGDVYAGWLDQNIGNSLAGRDALHMDAMLRRSLEQKAAARANELSAAAAVTTQESA